MSEFLLVRNSFFCTDGGSVRCRTTGHFSFPAHKSLPDGGPGGFSVTTRVFVLLTLTEKCGRDLCDSCSGVSNNRTVSNKLIVQSTAVNISINRYMLENKSSKRSANNKNTLLVL